MTITDSEIKTLAFYGSVSWANFLLKEAIKELKNVNRDLSARRFEVFYVLALLRIHGFTWQSRVLRYQIHLAVKNHQFSFTDERVRESDINQEIEEAS